MPKWKKQKEILAARLQEVDERIHEVEDQLEEPHSKDFEDFAKETEDTEVLEGLGLAGQREIAAINAALGRIEDGSYGICAKCGDDISAARLEAVPYAALCRNCA